MIGRNPKRRRVRQRWLTHSSAQSTRGVKAPMCRPLCWEVLSLFILQNSDKPYEVLEHSD